MSLASAHIEWHSLPEGHKYSLYLNKHPLPTTDQANAMRLLLCTLLTALMWPTTVTAEPDAQQLITQAMDLWRGKSSTGNMTMTIHRPTWQRSMSIDSWTLGLEQSLLRVTGPAKDAGNATLLIDKAMWSFSPRINRVIKIPASLMQQSWMGSDLSNRDITKSTEIIDQYEHRISRIEHPSEHAVYVIESTPHDDAAVVWGKEIYWVRDDFIVLKQEFWDQDNRLVKTIDTLQIIEVDGRPVASHMRVQDVDKADEWTELRINSIRFDIDIADSVFTVANLRRGQ